MSSLFNGLRVLDFGQGYAAIPGMILADYGADVVKVEPPGGEAWRGTPGFRQWNRGKRGIVLDLNTENARDQARTLALSSDVLIEAFRPGVLEKWGLGYDDMAPNAPALVYLSITGFGRTGPDAQLKAHEGIVAAKCGQFVIQNG